jgi:hypothetical protein
MQFRLIYDGPLRSNGDARHKQEIRRALHPQLRELWTHEPLANFADEWLRDEVPQESLSVIQSVGGFRFAPLVCDKLKLIAEVSIVLLRPTRPGALIRQGGDIDNQLKTLFDALRCPQSPNEVPDGDAPGDGEDPLFCLLDDDERIADLHVETDRYLAAPGERSVHTTIFVRTRPTKVIYANLPLS